MYQGLGYELAAVVPTVLATGICKSLCTIQQPDGVLIDAGQPSGNYLDVPGLVNIVVLSAPLSELRLQASEQKALEDIQTFAPRHVWLAGYFPLLAGIGAEDGWQAVVDGTTFDLLGSECDSQTQTTRIAVRTSGM